MALTASIAAVGAIASTAGSISSARAQKKADSKRAKNQASSIADLARIRNNLTEELLSGNFLDRFGSADVFGRRPEELDFAQSQRRAAQVNLENLPLNQQLVDRANQAGSSAAIDRAAILDPNFRQNISQLSESARSLLAGEIPDDVLSSIRRSRAEGAASGIGVIGAQRNATSRDLGLTSLDLQGRGASLFQQINATREAIDPIGRQVALSQLLLSPEQQIQQDTANTALRASADPAAAQFFNNEFLGSREEALARGQVTVPVNNALGAGLSGLGGSLTGLLQGGFFGTPGSGSGTGGGLSGGGGLSLNRSGGLPGFSFKQ